MLAILLACVFFASCKHDDDPTPDPKEYATVDKAVLVYIVAENSLADYADADIAEICAGASKMSKQNRVLVYVDDIDLPRIYEIRDTTQYKYLKPVKQYETDWLSTDTTALKDVVNYMETNYVANSYGIVFWSHADGWTPTYYEYSHGTRSFGVDNGVNVNYNNDVSQNGSQMSITNMASVLQQFPKFEFIMFDACFMQSIESDYTLRNCADYILSSPAEIPGEGAPYHKVVPAMFSESSAPVAMAQAYYNYYKNDDGVVISVVDCSQLENLAAETSNIISAYSSSDLTGVEYYYNGELASRPHFYDFKQLIHHWCTDTDAYSKWCQAYDKAVVYKAGDKWFSSYGDSRTGTYMTIEDTENNGCVNAFVPRSKHPTLNSFFIQTEWYKAAWGGVNWWN